MTYIYYKSSTYTTEPKISEKQMDEWRHLADKKNWRITQLPNGYYQTEVNKPNNDDTENILSGISVIIDEYQNLFQGKIEELMNKNNKRNKKD